MSPMPNPSPATHRGRRLALAAVAVAVALVGCSDEKPLIEQAGVPTTALPSVPVSSRTKDGQVADAAKVAAVLQRLSGFEGADAVAGVETVRGFYRTQMLALGMSQEEATCIADALVAAAGPEAASMTLAELAQSGAGLDANAMTACVSPDRLAAMAGQPPDHTRIPPAEFRADLIARGTVAMASMGLSTEEAACVNTTTYEQVSDDDLVKVLSGELSANDYFPDAIASCLTAARIDELADR